MKRITDLHTHILPDVDDGAPSLAMALEVIKELSNQGITNIFATSHSFAFIDEKSSSLSHSAFRQLQDSIDENEIPVRLFLGCEILCLERWMDRILYGLERGQYPSLNGSRYILIEFSTMGITRDEVDYCVDRILRAGWIPVFAHVERYADSFADLPFILEMKKKGCLFQMNFNSLYEEASLEIRDFARKIIDCEIVDFLGSDSHSMNHRPPQIRNGLHYLEEHCSLDYLERIMFRNLTTYFDIQLEDL